MHLELMRDPERDFPRVEQPLAYRSAELWHCKYRTLVRLAELENLETLIVVTYPDESLDILRGLRKLRYLRLHHLPRVTELAPLVSLENLEVLALETTPGWDSSGKVQVVTSLAPLAQLPRLQHLELFGVRPADKSLAPLEHCPALRTAALSKFPAREVTRFFEATGVREAHNPEPIFSTIAS